MANKIKQISIGGVARDVYDVEAAHTINGYTADKFVKAPDAPEGTEPPVTFANKAISTKEIDDMIKAIFTTQASTEGGN